MEESASTLSRPTVGPRGDRSHGRLQIDLHRDYEAAHGRSIRTERQRELIEAAGVWLLRAQAHEGPDFIRSGPQIARAFGYPVEGLTVREISDRFGTSIRNTLGYLQAMGWIESFAGELGRHGDYDGLRIKVGPKALGRPAPATLGSGGRRSSSAGRAPVL